MVATLGRYGIAARVCEQGGPTPFVLRGLPNGHTNVSLLTLGRLEPHSLPLASARSRAELPCSGHSCQAGSRGGAMHPSYPAHSQL